jgi:hypothetical protein
VTVLVPPVILDEMQAVFHLPMVTSIGLKLSSGDRCRIKTGGKIPAVTREDCAMARSHFTIDAQCNLVIGNVQTLAEIGCGFEVEPEPARLVVEPLFSVISWAGRKRRASAKHVFKASNTSAWLALI